VQPVHLHHQFGKGAYGLRTVCAAAACGFVALYVDGVCVCLSVGVWLSLFPAGPADLPFQPPHHRHHHHQTIGSFFSLSYGIIGLYFTVVLAIGRFVHMSVMNKKYGIICDDLPRVQVLKEMCETIYLARMYKNLALEEELYRELIDVYRRPQLIFTRTGPYRHW
jgi:hypothetical protein